MKNFISIIFSIILFSQFVHAKEIETLFNQAVAHYQKGEYEQTVNLFEQILSKGYKGKSLYYNLGNAYFRLGKIGLAILNYERAKKLSPSDEDVNHNLTFANSRLIDKIETLPRFLIFDWWENLLSSMSIDGWAYVTYFFYILILVSVGCYYFARNLKIQRFGFYSGFVSLVLLVFVIILLVVNLNREFNVKHGIIIDQEVVTKFSPDLNSKDAFVVHEGLKVKTEDSIGGWIKIKLIDGKVGWVKSSSLEVI
ncbi:MAG: tetratricopeptide repeat protein [Ignavibacteriaceae bacterium]|nr:tetratricopeptide repeat protein [Ignavibacteriaceae bacterium]